MRTLRERWMGFWFEPSSSVNLGVCRALFCGGLFLYYLPRDFSAWGEVSRVFWLPIWLFQVAHLPPASADMLQLLQGPFKTALGLGCLGLLTRPSLSVACALSVYLFGLQHSFGKTDHYDAIVVFLLGILALSRCGDGWSLDRLIRLARQTRDVSAARVSASGEYTWPVRLVWVLFALIFFGAGLAKFRYAGLKWLLPDNLANTFIAHNYYHGPLTDWGLYVAQVPWVCSLLALGTMVCETGYPLALISRWARWIIVPSVFLMQVGIRLFMGPVFTQCLIANLFWVPWDRLGAWLQQRLHMERTHAVLFDGQCGLCQGTVALIRALDLTRRVEYHDAANNWSEIARRFPHVQQEACLQDMHLVTASGRIVTGFDAYRALAWVLPLGWIALPVLYLPGVRWAGRRLYAVIAARRNRSHCPLPLAEMPS